MIDVVFFLLVFFMVASLAMSVHRGLPVGLPPAVTGRPARDDRVTVTVDREGRLYVDREPTTREALEDRLRARLAGRPDLAVTIAADGDVVHRRVVEVVDAARAAGAHRLAIAVAPGERVRRP